MKNAVLKKGLALFLALIMCIGMLPISALALDDSEDTEITEAGGDQTTGGEGTTGGVTTVADGNTTVVGDVTVTGDGNTTVVGDVTVTGDGDTTVGGDVTVTGSNATTVVESTTDTDTGTGNGTETVYYTITFLNGDGSVLETVKVAENEMPVCSKTPTKEPTTTDVYTFGNCWTPELVPATDDATYTPVFTSGPRYYTVQLVDSEDGVAVASAEFKYNEVPSFDK
ncbi:MAG: hypothetical protein IJH53_02585, partial [Oscillospiraceae bacterium]|nr:hypothetical protein [Oscillospiraceae bacterium]